MKDEFQTDVFSLNDFCEDSAVNNEANIEQPKDDKKIADDEFVIGSGFALPQTNEKGFVTKRKPKSRTKGIIRSLLWILFVLITSATLAVTAIYCVIDYMGLGDSKTITIDITEDKSLDEITDDLHEKGAVRFKWFFKTYCETKGYYEKFTTGVHTIKTDMGYSAIVNEFAYTEGMGMETVTVTIPEMSSIDDIAKILDKNKVCTKEQFYNVARNGEFDYDFLDDIPKKTVHYRLEGYLFPDTYEFYVWGTEEGAKFAIDKMLANYDSKFNEKYRKRAKKLGYTMHEITTMASIIEMECSGYTDEMPKVSAVFYNRLEHWGDQPKMLGSSPTAEYPYGSGNYDTNKIEGLPPGPYCAPSENAIKAALYPKESYEKTYFYFVTDTNGKFYYTRNLDEHNSVIYTLSMQGIWGEE